MQGCDTETKLAEIDRNLEWFLEQLPSLVTTHLGEWALLRRRTVVGFHQSALDAQIAGNQQFEDGRFSIQCVDPKGRITP
jgi:hypothetical protein